MPSQPKGEESLRRFGSVLKFGAVALAASLTLGVVACSEDDDGGDTTPAAATATEVDATETPEASPTRATTGTTGAAGATGATGADGERIEVTAMDYEFEGLPETVEAGSTFFLMNESTEEVHEMVAILLPEDEERSVEELLQLPEEELGEIGQIEPSFVIVAAPGGEGLTVLGEPTLTESGRYLFACFIPVGADPDEFLGEATGTEPPEVAGGPPHFTEGMYAEVTVE